MHPRNDAPRVRYRRAVDAPHPFPLASRRTRLLLAALVWSGVGTGLLAAGLHWLLAASPRFASAGLASALAVGVAKGRLVLARRAEANARRIEGTPEHGAVLGFFAPSAWGLAAGMMAAGALLRRSALPRPWLGILYAAIGVALLSASVPAWRHWSRARAEEARR